VDADAVIRAYAIRAATDNCTETDQYARMLAVALWHDVDTQLFNEVVSDMDRVDEIQRGADLDQLYGTVDPDDPLDEPMEDGPRRADWIAYYEDAIKFSIRQLLDSAGY
jgi:hypothetical protein